MKKVETTKVYYVFDEEDRKDIKKQMIDLNLTATTLAKKINVSNAYMSAIINGDRRLTPKILDSFKSVGIIIKGE